MAARLKKHIKLFLKNYQNGTDKGDTDVNGNYLTEKMKTGSVKAGDGSTAASGAKVLVSLMKKLAEKEITEHEFIGNILLILLAGYETTANAFTYTLYLLAKHPEIQEKLREEIQKDGIESKYLDWVW